MPLILSRLLDAPTLAGLLFLPTGAGRKYWVRQTISHLPARISLSAAPLAALLFLAPTSPALAERCFGLNEIKSSCTTLSLISDNLSSLPPGIFSGLNNLTELSLSFNNLSSLPPGIFSGLNNLESLWLTDNNLRSLPPGIFSGLNNLESLSLASNNLRSLPPGIFSGLNNLESLTLVYNNLSCLPAIPPSVTTLVTDYGAFSNNYQDPLTLDYINININDSINDRGVPRCRGENRPPTATGLVPDQDLVIDGSVTVDTSRYFSDPDDDSLTYTASSSDPGKATVSVSGSTLTIAGVAEGSATITVTASDGGDEGTASTTFAVAVQRIDLEINRPPTATGLVPDQDLVIDGSVTVDTSRYFSDPDDDSLTYTASSSDPGKATVSVSGSTLTIAGVAEGSATITVTASDGGDEGTASTTFAVAVQRIDLEINRPPTATGLVPDQDLVIDGSVTVDTSRYFSDPDDDSLTYTASSSDPGKATVSVSGSTLTIAGVAEGSATITVTASDGGDEGTASTTFAVAVQRIDLEISVDEALGYLAEKAGTVVGTARAHYQQGGMTGLVDYVSEQFSAADGVDSAPSVAAKPKAAVQSRIGACSAAGAPDAASGGGADLSFLDQALERSADFLVAHHQEINAGRFHLDLPQALALLGTDFNLPLASLGLAQHAGQSDDASTSCNMVLWGSVDYSQFGDQANNFSTNGRNWTFTVGVDGHLKPDLLTGVALSLSTARSDYDYVGSAMSGEYDVDLTVVTPYVNWSANDSLDLWASVGYGKGSSQFSLQTIGDLDLASLQDLDQDATRQSQDSDFFSFAGGLRWDAIRSGDTQLAFKLAGSTTSFLETDSQQARLATQLSRDIHLAHGVLSPSMDLALLLDSTNSSVMEMVAGLDWAAANDKFTASAVGRTLLFSGDRYEWGVGAALNYQAGVRPGEGLSLSLQPSLGVTDSHLPDLDILSSADDTHLALRQWQPSARLNAQLRYGIPTGKAILTPYTQLNLVADHSTTYGAGLRYQLADSLDLDLSTSHRQRTSGTNDNRLFLRLRTDL